MKILQLSTTLEGGAGLAARRLNAALNATGLESEILSIGKEFKILQNNEKFYERSRVTKLKSSILTFLQYKFLQKGSNLVTTNSISVFKSIDLFRNFDIIHIHATYNFIDDNIFEALYNSNLRLFITMHDQRIFTGGCHYSHDCEQFISGCVACPQVKSIFKKQVLKSQKQKVKLFGKQRRIGLISPSTWLANLAKSSEAFNQKEISIVLNPVPELFSHGNPNELRAKFNYNSHESVVNFIAANLTNPNKGLTTIFDAISNMSSDKKKKLRLVLIGKKGNLKIPPNIICEVLEHQTEIEIAQRLRAGDALIVPSFKDNSPNVIGEALMAGSMVFGSDVGGISEVMRIMNFQTFPAGDYSSLSKILNEFDRHYDKNEVTRIAKTLYSYKEVGNKVKQLYLEQIKLS